MDFTDIANSFVEHYYRSFDTSGVTRKGLAIHYRPQSMLAWDDQKYSGVPDIMGALTRAGLAFANHSGIATVAQPTPGGGVLVAVTGDVAFDSTAHTPMPFAETFNLSQEPNQSGLFIYNQIFRSFAK
jgi:Nuclear transport factor 2 (NTF2) domain